MENDELEVLENEEETIDWQAKYEEEKQAREAEEGRRKRAEGKLEKNKVAPKQDKPTETEGLDRMDRAILRMEKITSEEEISLVESIMADTGKNLEQVLASKYFQAELKEMRELQDTENAKPTTSKRTQTSTRDSVEYWIAKGELPTDPTLRIKVVNAKIAKEKSGSQFSNNPIS